MKSVVLIKMFLVLCCQLNTDKNGHVYEVKNLNDSTELGTVFSTIKYNQGDTIVLKLSQKEF